MWLTWWLMDNWLIVLAVMAVGVAYIIGGWRLALGVATAGIGVLLYRQGHKDAERAYDEKAERIENERDEAYNQIDRRGTTGSDVRDRLQSGDY